MTGAPERPDVVTLTVRYIGGHALAHPLTITFRADMRADVEARLLAAGLEIDGKQASNFF